MKTETDLLVEDGARRAGMTTNEFVRKQLSLMAITSPNAPISESINSIAAREYEQQQKDTAQCV